MLNLNGWRSKFKWNKSSRKIKFDGLLKMEVWLRWWSKLSFDCSIFMIKLLSMKGIQKELCSMSKYKILNGADECKYRGTWGFMCFLDAYNVIWFCKIFILTQAENRFSFFTTRLDCWFYFIFCFGQSSSSKWSIIPFLLVHQLFSLFVDMQMAILWGMLLVLHQFEIISSKKWGPAYLLQPCMLPIAEH